MTIYRVGKIAAKEAAVFICDIQEKFRDKVKYFAAIAQVTSRILKTANILDLPIIVTEQYPKGLGYTVPEIGLDKYPHIKPITKTQLSMLTPQVVDLLQTQYSNVKSVILTGIETHACVQLTCLNLLEHGYDVHIVADASSSRTMVDRLYAFDRMKASGAWVTTSESIILSLVKDSSHEKFKEIQKIILETAPDSGLVSYIK